MPDNNIITHLLSEALGRSAVLVDEPMSRHTTFKIGGNADIMVMPDSAHSLAAALKILKEFNCPYFVMGNGSDLLVGDKGIRGAVIKIGERMMSCDVSGHQLSAQSGIKLSRLANIALKNDLTGLEFAAGIPGTLGGAVYMNAGAYGGEMKDVIKNVTYVDGDDFSVNTILGSDCRFGYRQSIFNDSNKIVTEVTLGLNYGINAEIKEKMSDLAARRSDKQPIDKPSAGSTFKRPTGYFAGTLIQDAGLKGLSVGGAEVSKKHAGFIINTGNATAKDVRELIELVQAKVYEKFGVKLEPEVKFVGEF